MATLLAAKAFYLGIVASQATLETRIANAENRPVENSRKTLALLILGSCLYVVSAPVCATSVFLSDKMLNPDSTARPGVVVSLSGTTLATTTDANGVWSFSEATDGILSGASTATAAPTRHLTVRNGRLSVSLSGHDLAGHPSSGNVRAASTTVASASRTHGAAPDTLIYSWNGTTILRDTLSSLDQSGILRFFDTTINAAITYGYAWDDQMHLYRTVQVGDQVWTAENSKYKVDSSWCYSESADSCSKYGRLYDWAGAMRLADSCDSKACTTQVTAKVQGVCPSGWHVPSIAEWTKLTDTALPSVYAGRVLKSLAGWLSDAGMGGLDSVGFHVLPAGYRDYSGIFHNVDAYAEVWTSSAATTSAYYPFVSSIISFYYQYAFTNRTVYMSTYGASIRCLKDD